MKITHVLICLLLLAADVAIPLASATHTSETDVPLGPPPQVESGAPVATDFMPADQLQEDLLEMVGPPANKALVDAYDRYHALRADIEEQSTKGFIVPYRDGMGADARDGASLSDSDLRLGGFGAWRVIGDAAWGLREDAAHTGVAGYTSATMADGTYGGNVRSLLLSPKLDLRTGMDYDTGSQPGSAINTGKGHIYSSGQPEDAVYEFSFSTRYNLGYKQDGINVLVFSDDPGDPQSWDQGAPNEKLYGYPGIQGISVGVPGSKLTSCVNIEPPCWEFIEPIEMPYTEMNSGQRAFTGRSPGGEWVTYHLDLSKWAEETIWIGFSFKTAGTPPGYFQSNAFDTDFEFYGFELDDVRLEMPSVPYSLSAQTPNLPLSQYPSSRTGLHNMPTVPADASTPMSFDVVNMGLMEAQVEATVFLYDSEGNTIPLPNSTFGPLPVGPGGVERFIYNLPPLENLRVEGSIHTIHVQVKNVEATYRTAPTDPDPDPLDNTQSLAFNVITFEDVHAGRLTQSATFAGFGEPVTFELPVRNLGNNPVIIEADACGVDLSKTARTCTDELFSHGEATAQSALLESNTEHTFRWEAKGSTAGQHRIFVRAGTALETVPQFSTDDDFRIELLSPLRSRHVTDITVDGKADEPAWLLAPTRALPDGRTIRILNSDTHVFFAIHGSGGFDLLLDDLADHVAHDGGEGGIRVRLQDDGDNCPTVYNPDQTDTDGDGVGDACDSENEDGDLHNNDVDNCPYAHNDDQLDTNGDGVGDACDGGDTDGDGIPDGEDPCPYSPGSCNYPDFDGDGTLNEEDNCPYLSNDQVDNNNNNIGDVCEGDEDGDGFWQALRYDAATGSWSFDEGEYKSGTLERDSLYEVAIPIANINRNEGLVTGPGNYLGLFLGSVVMDPYPIVAESTDANENGLVDELYVWQPVRLGMPDDVVSNDVVRRFQFRGLSAGLGVERSPPPIMQEDFQQCPDMSQWVQENVKKVGGKSEKWNCAEYGPDRRLVLYEGLSPDSSCGEESCPPWSQLGVPHLGHDAHSARTWKDTYDSGITYTPPFVIDSPNPYLFLQHQYATESWLVDDPGFVGNMTIPSNHRILGTEDPNVRTAPIVGPLPRVQPMIDILSAGRIYLEIWNDETQSWQERILIRPEGGYTTEETIGILDSRFDEKRHVRLSYVDAPTHITTDTDGIGFWWPTGFQPLHRPSDENIAVGAEFAGSPWLFDRFRLQDIHKQFQESVAPEANPPPPIGLDLVGRTARVIFDFQRSQGDSSRDYGWRIGGLAIVDGSRFQRDLSVDAVQIGELLYDPSLIGVGPGSVVPVIASLSNQGTADLPGISISLQGIDTQDSGATPLCKMTKEFSVSIAPGESRDFELNCALPSARNGALLLLHVEALPMTGDDFPANNRRNVPELFELRATPDLAVQVTADPSVASRDVKRTVTVMVENRGNIPVSGFDVELQMQQVTGVGRAELLGPPIQWHVTSELPVNTRMRLDDPRVETEPAVERPQLLFKPPEQGVFKTVARVVSTDDTNPSNDAAGATMHARSRLYQENLDRTPFASPDIVSGKRTINGTDGVWSVQTGSHEGSKRLLAGDPLTEEIPANSSSSILLPDLDFTTIKGATLTLKHRYALEQGFDGARLELSSDGGETWRALHPRPQPLGDLPDGYPSITMIGVSPLLDGEAEATAIAFTGNSAQLNASETDNFDRRTGWITSEFDLSSHPDLQRWTAIDAFTLNGFASTPEDRPETMPSGERQYRHASWTLDEPGAEGNQRYWWIQDIASDIAPHSGETMWWSGTSGTEQEKFQDVETILTFDLLVPEVEDGRKIFFSWWEHRAGSGDSAGRNGTGGTFSVQVGPLLDELAAHAAHGKNDGDGDYLHDQSERTVFGTDPNRWDSDGDGLADYQESKGQGANTGLFHSIAHEKCEPASDYTHLPRCDGGYQTGAMDWDSDGDDWADGSEVHAGTDPNNRDSKPIDTDLDMLPDDWEILYFGSLQQNSVDEDGDGLSNVEEQWFGSSPIISDTDFDGISDFMEWKHGLNPVVSDLPEARASIIEEKNQWIKREVDVTSYGGIASFIRYEYKSIPGEAVDSPARIQNNLGWLLDDFQMTSYATDASTGFRTHPQVHDHDDLETPGSPGWTIGGSGWHRATAMTERATVWQVQLEQVPGQDATPVWRFSDKSEQGYPHGIDTRLVTPAIDLTKLVGDKASLSFDHRYGFESKHVCNTTACNSGTSFISALDGGTVEVQIFNQTTGKYDPWMQIGANYNDFPQVRLESVSDGVKIGKLSPNALLTPIASTGYSAIEEKGSIIANTYYNNGCANGFYVDNNYVANGIGTTFEPKPGIAKWTINPCSDDFNSAFKRKYVNWRSYDVAYVFSGDSNGWQTNEWDISPLIGEKVRFSFHAATNPSLTEPCLEDNNEKPCHGWSIANVAVEGSLFQGKPVQARLHLATDGSLTKGEWSVDDVELVGDRYKDNVAIIADTAPEVQADHGEAVVFDAQVANIGTNRRGALAIAVQALDADKRPYEVTVHFEGDAPEDVPSELRPAGTHQAFGPFSLNPGGQAGSSLPFQVRLNLPEEDARITLRVHVLQATGEPVLVDGKNEFAYVIPNNEVSGNTFATWTAVGHSMTDLHITTDGGINVQPGAPRVGEQVRISSTIENLGTTEPDVVARWSIYEMQRKGDPTTQPEVGTEIRNEILQVDRPLGVVPRKATALTQQNFTPEQAGLYRAVVEYVTAGDVQARAQWEFLIDTTADYYQIDFSKTNSTAGQWSDASPDSDGTHGGSPEAIRFRHDGRDFVWGVDTGQRAADKNYCDFGGNPCNVQGCATSCSAQGRENYYVGLEGIGTSPFIDLTKVPQGNAIVTLRHSLRFSPDDGARVEAIPYQPSSDGDLPQAAILCHGKPASFVLSPMNPTAYDGLAKSAPRTSHSTPPMTPPNPPSYEIPERFHPFAVSGSLSSISGPLMMSEARSNEIIRFDLSTPALATDPSCEIAPLNLLNYTLALRLHVGQLPGYSSPYGSLGRDGSHGWQIHEISVSSIAVDVTPDHRRFPVLDGAPKSFGFNVHNAGQIQETFRISLDQNESTLPDPAWISLSSDEITLQAGKTATVPFLVNIPPDPNLSRGAYTARLEARSASSPSIVDFIDVVLDLQSNPLPDLSVSLSTDDGGKKITQGSISPIYVTVRNLGQQESKSVRVQLSAVDETGAATPIDTLILPALCPQTRCGGGSRVTRAADWLVPEMTGNYTLVADVDVDGRLLEERRDNNLASLLVEVVPLAVPDLAITALTVEGVGADGFAEEGDLLVYRATVHNLGLRDANNVQVQILADSALLAEESILVLAAGQSREVTAYKVGSRGETIALVHVLPDDAELNTDNNQFKQSVRVRGHDLSASLVPARPLLAPGAVATVLLNVSNDGNTVERLLVSLEDAPGWNVSITPDPLFVAPGRNGTASLRIHVAEDAVAGIPALRLIIAPATNAGAAVFINAPFEVESVGGAPLLESDGTTAPPGAVDLPVNVTSTTNAPQRVTLRLASPDWKHEPLDLSLRPHGLLPLNLSVTIPAGTSVGNHTLQLESVNADGTVLSQTVATVTVLEQRRIEAAWSEVRSSRFAEVGNQSFEVSLRAANAGNVPVELTLVPIDLAQNTSARPLVGRALEPGAAQTLVLRVDSEASALSPLFGNVQVWMRTVGAEGRGTLAHTLALPAPTDAADLHVVRLDLSPRKLHAGDTVHVSAVVENQGVLLSNTSRMHIFLNGALLEDLEVPAVPAGGNAVVNATWTVQRSGTFHIVVLADAEGSVGELEEANNGLTRTLDVEDTPFVPSFVERHIPTLPLLPLLLVGLANAWLRRRKDA